MGGVSTLMDLMSSEYGWTDDVVLDLPLSRAVQVRDAIQIRQITVSKVELGVTEWLAKTISSFVISSSGMIDQKSAEKLHAALGRVSITGSDTTSDEEYSYGSDERSLADIIENGSVEQAAARNATRDIGALFGA